MPYIENRIVYDADVHTVETADNLAEFAWQKIKRDGTAATASTRSDLEKVLAMQRDDTYRAVDLARCPWGVLARDER